MSWVIINKTSGSTISQKIYFYFLSTSTSKSTENLLLSFRPLKMIPDVRSNVSLDIQMCDDGFTVQIWDDCLQSRCDIRALQSRCEMSNWSQDVGVSVLPSLLANSWETLAQETRTTWPTWAPRQHLISSHFVWHPGAPRRNRQGDGQTGRQLDKEIERQWDRQTMKVYMAPFKHKPFIVLFKGRNHL